MARGKNPKQVISAFVKGKSHSLADPPRNDFKWENADTNAASCGLKAKIGDNEVDIKVTFIFGVNTQQEADSFVLSIRSLCNTIGSKLAHAIKDDGSKALFHAQLNALNDQPGAMGKFDFDARDGEFKLVVSTYFTKASGALTTEILESMISWSCKEWIRVFSSAFVLKSLFELAEKDNRQQTQQRPTKQMARQDSNSNLFQKSLLNQSGGARVNRVEAGAVIHDNKNVVEVDAIQIRRSDLNFKEADRIGGGAFGEVFRGEYVPTKQTVAIKRLKKNPDMTQHLFNMQVLSEVKALRVPAPYCVRFLGIAKDRGGDLMIVTEYCDGGTLSDVIKDKKCGWRQRLGYLIQVVTALSDLHSRMTPTIHRDLKPDNILIDRADKTAKVADFGLAVTQKRIKEGEIAGTLSHMAPELLIGQPATPMSDVYAFGTIMWEMCFSYEMSVGDYFPTLPDGAQLVDLVKLLASGIRPHIPKRTSTDLALLIKECWNSHPQVRPRATDILERLNDMKQGVKKWKTPKKLKKGAKQKNKVTKVSTMRL